MQGPGEHWICVPTETYSHLIVPSQKITKFFSNHKREHVDKLINLNVINQSLRAVSQQSANPIEASQVGQLTNQVSVVWGELKDEFNDISSLINRVTALKKLINNPLGYVCALIVFAIGFYFTITTWKSHTLDQNIKSIVYILIIALALSSVTVQAGENLINWFLRRKLDNKEEKKQALLEKKGASLFTLLTSYVLEHYLHTNDLNALSKHSRYLNKFQEQQFPGSKLLCHQVIRERIKLDILVETALQNQKEEESTVFVFKNESVAPDDIIKEHICKTLVPLLQTECVKWDPKPKKTALDLAALSRNSQILDV